MKFNSCKDSRTKTCLVQENETNPEVESVPRLFLRVDAVDLGPADGPDIRLVALFEVDKLREREEQPTL